MIGGALYFNIVPKLLDKNIPQDALIFGATFWVLVFDLFINLHHYVIDNAIWRSDNPHLKKFLFLNSDQ